MWLLPISRVLPSSLVTSTFMAPDALHTSTMLCGLTMGEATATPNDSTQHASMQRAMKEQWRRVCMDVIIYDSGNAMRAMNTGNEPAMSR